MAVFKLNETDYGGIFDIDDDIFFTKEEIVEFGNDIAEEFDNIHNNNAYLLDVYFDTPKILHLDITDDEYEYPIEVRIDMRKIRSPRDIDKYKKQMLAELERQYEDYHQYDNYYESYRLKESDDYSINADGTYGVVTHEDLGNFADEVVEEFNKITEEDAYAGEVFFTKPDTIMLYASGLYNGYTVYVNVDMNKIKNSKDIYKYKNKFVKALKEQYDAFVEKDGQENASIEDIWTAVCSGNLNTVKKLINDDYIKANQRWSKFGTNHSLIMGAARNNNFDVVSYLLSIGGTIEPSETAEFASFIKKNNNKINL